MIPQFGRGHLTGFVNISVTGTVTSTGNMLGARFLAAADSAAAPGHSWQDDTNTGPYNNAADSVGMSLGAGNYFALSATAATINVPINAAVGALTLLAGPVVTTPATAQSVTGVGVALTPTTYIHEFTSDANYTLTVAPTIANGADGQFCLLVNVGANIVTIQDQGTLASSNLRLTGASVAIGPRDSVLMYYSGDVADWVQVGPLVSVV